MVGLVEAGVCHGMPDRAQSCEKNEPHGDKRFKEERGFQEKKPNEPKSVAVNDSSGALFCPR
jgi:hypothetical protein